jgi:hypothetical protein
MLVDLYVKSLLHLVAQMPCYQNTVITFHISWKRNGDTGTKGNKTNSVINMACWSVQIQQPVGTAAKSQNVPSYSNCSHVVCQKVS